MKNIKKLLVVLPLVLVLVLSVLPVNAEELPVLNGFATSIATTAFGDLQGFMEYNMTRTIIEKWNGQVAPLGTGTNIYPIWLGQSTTNAVSAKVVPTRGGNVRLMNNGYPVGYVEANPSAASALQIAKTFIANNYPEYNIPSFNLNNVTEVTVTVQVPGSWVGKEAANVATFTLNENVPGFKADEEATKTDLLAAGAQIVEQTVEGKEIVQITLGKQTVKAKASEDGTKYTPEADLYLYVKGQDVTNVKGATFTTAEPSGKTTVNFGKKDENYEVTKTVKAGAETLVDAQLKGYLVTVEDKYVPVKVNHHYRSANGEEIVQTTNETVAYHPFHFQKMTAADVNPVWYKELANYKIDNTATQVDATVIDNSLTQGEVFYDSYVVDLYYVAAQETNSEIDAAFTNTQAGVQNMGQAASLPATGAASNAVAIVASAVAVALGFLLKK